MQAEIVMLMMNEVGVVDVGNENDVDDYDVVDDKGSVSATLEAGTTGWRNKCQGLSRWCKR